MRSSTGPPNGDECAVPECVGRGERERCEIGNATRWNPSAAGVSGPHDLDKLHAMATGQNDKVVGQGTGGWSAMVVDR